MRFNITSALLLLLCVSFSSADLLVPRPVESQDQVQPMSVRSHLGAFKENELASAQVSGNGASCLGLYVFDGDGSCVMMDDLVAPRYCDELKVAWIADGVGRYAVSLRNGGIERPKYNLAIR